MEVFIGNLSLNITHNDLVVFFKGFANKAKLRVVDKQREDGSKVRYGVATFDSDKLALKAIRKLNHKPLRGVRVELREYFHRYCNNERRAVNWRNKPWTGVERRQQERRKQQAHAESPDKLPKKGHEQEETIRISGYAHLARKG